MLKYYTIHDIVLSVLKKKVICYQL